MLPLPPEDFDEKVMALHCVGIELQAVTASARLKKSIQF
jgi:hypothetical protein